MSFKLPKEPKLRRDWVGKFVMTNRQLVNGYITIPEGSICLVEAGHRGANLESEPCPCCKVHKRIGQVPWDDLIYIGTTEDLNAYVESIQEEAPGAQGRVREED